MSFQIIKDFSKSVLFEPQKIENSIDRETKRNSLNLVEIEQEIHSYNSILYSSELNLFCSLSCKLDRKPIYSNDRINWFEGTISQQGNFRFYKGAYGLTKSNIPTFVFVGVGPNSIIQSTNWAYSNDGINWNSFSNLTDDKGNIYQPYYVMFNITEKIFICVCGEERTISFLKSDDGISWTFLSKIISEFNFGIPIGWSPDLKQYLFIIGHLNPSKRKVFTSSDCIQWNEILSFKDVPYGCNNSILDLPWSPRLGVFLIAPYLREYCYLTENGSDWYQITYPCIIQNSDSKWCSEKEAFIIENNNKNNTESNTFHNAKQIIINDLQNWNSV